MTAEVSVLSPLSLPRIHRCPVHQIEICSVPAKPKPAPDPALKALPIIKWVGGKTRLLDELVSRMPSNYARYYEPFAGGAALFFRIAPDRYNRSVLADSNPHLVELYRVIAEPTRLDKIIRKLRRHENAHGKRYYYSLRKSWNAKRYSWTDVERAAAFLYFNKTCFNGLYRVNRAGDFNTPMGDYDEPAICMPELLRAASHCLANTELRCGDYQEVVRDAGAGDFVYFDPPYDPVSATASFTGYSATGFDRDDQSELAELAKRLVARGCAVMLSNSNTRFVRSLYKGFQIDRVKCPRAINSDTQKRGGVAEVIITGGYR